ncbi:MAG: UDP-N-acetylglucosamine 2-epimerase (non-hydrolyzing) [Bacilli bacterium]|nr:UDP-N-acetylglucosamine 2-epimerase (non-hydrolyzing) [Bacilli bacterium]
MKIVTIVGARPQFIKAAQFSLLFREKYSEILVHTGQHYDSNMSEIFFDELNIPKPNYNLNVGSGSQGIQTAKMIEKIEEVLIFEKPNAIIIYGDTNSTLAGAIASSKLHIPIYHVEAGLRSYNKTMPEEINRVLADHISTLLFCPTQTAVTNLHNEGIIKGVYNVGDIMYDAIIRNIKLAKKKYSHLNWTDAIRSEVVDIKSKVHQGFYLATIHRAENTNDIDKLYKIFTAFENLSKPVIMPLHPRTKNELQKLDIQLKNTIIIDPVGYLLMLYLTSSADMVITDSGGLQKEAFLLKTPCTTLRDQTEWVETLDGGCNLLSEIEVATIIEKVSRDVNTINFSETHVFGDGYAALKIMNIIEKELNKK